MKRFLYFGVTSTILIIIGLIVLDLVTKKFQIRNYCKDTQIFVNNNFDSFNKIAVDIFDLAKDCGNGDDCKPTVVKEIFNALPSSYTQLSLPSSTYFVRYSREGLIEKMFLSGEYYAKTLEYDREKYVASLIKNSRLMCGRGWKIDGTSQATKSMTFLRDIESEAEVFIPIGKTQVSVVRLWGD